MKLCVELHSRSMDEIIYLNPDHVVGIENNNEGSIVYTLTKKFFVKETAKEAKDIIFPDFKVEDLFQTTTILPL